MEQGGSRREEGGSVFLFSLFTIHPSFLLPPFSFLLIVYSILHNQSNIFHRCNVQNPQTTQNPLDNYIEV